MIEPVEQMPEETPPSVPDRAGLREAGAAFEAMMLQQMLGNILPETSAFGGHATQALARQLAADSPFGIATMLKTQTR
ncbi:MAG: hypothetical protein ACK5SX_04580 [Sandaracinobacter sp.]